MTKQEIQEFISNNRQLIDPHVEELEIPYNQLLEARRANEFYSKNVKYGLKVLGNINWIQEKLGGCFVDCTKGVYTWKDKKGEIHKDTEGTLRDYYQINKAVV